jgi:hypothetical protein
MVAAFSKYGTSGKLDGCKYHTPEDRKKKLLRKTERAVHIRHVVLLPHTNQQQEVLVKTNRLLSLIRHGPH